jgi:methyl-accepting chemotaxis protein
MGLLARVGVAARLAALVLVSILGLFLMQRSTIDTFEEKSLQLKETELTHLTELALSIVKTYHSRAESGDMSTEEAQAKALEVLDDLEYEGDNFFWVIDSGPIILMHGHNSTLTGRDASTIADPNGVLLFNEMVDGPTNR